jgi:hypothetical protein
MVVRARRAHEEEQLEGLCMGQMEQLEGLGGVLGGTKRAAHAGGMDEAADMRLMELVDGGWMVGHVQMAWM